MAPVSQARGGTDVAESLRLRKVWHPILLAAVLVAVGCGSADKAAPAGDTTATASTDDGAIPISAIVRPDSVYSIDDLAAVGYKKSKEFSTDTVPHATAVWYGFFNQRDIEVRVYGSHEDAKEHGIGPAEEAIGRPAGQTDYLIPVVNRYPAYMVVGNLVMLCERELPVCEALVEKLP